MAANGFVIRMAVAAVAEATVAAHSGTACNGCGRCRLRWLCVDCVVQPIRRTRRESALLRDAVEHARAQACAEARKAAPAQGPTQERALRAASRRAVVNGTRDRLAQSREALRRERQAFDHARARLGRRRSRHRALGELVSQCRPELGLFPAVLYGLRASTSDSRRALRGVQARLTAELERIYPVLVCTPLRLWRLSPSSSGETAEAGTACGAGSLEELEYAAASVGHVPVPGGRLRRLAISCDTHAAQQHPGASKAVPAANGGSAHDRPGDASGDASGDAVGGRSAEVDGGHSSARRREVTGEPAAAAAPAATDSFEPVSAARVATPAGAGAERAGGWAKPERTGVGQLASLGPPPVAEAFAGQGASARMLQERLLAAMDHMRRMVGLLGMYLDEPTPGPEVVRSSDDLSSAIERLERRIVQLSYRTEALPFEVLHARHCVPLANLSLLLRTVRGWECAQSMPIRRMVRTSGQGDAERKNRGRANRANDRAGEEGRHSGGGGTRADDGGGDDDWDLIATAS